MPKAKHHEAMARQWEILKMIPGREPGITAKSIVNRLDLNGVTVSKRTVERDLNQLSLLFGLVTDSDEKPYHWYWMDGQGVDLPSMTLADALSLKIVEDNLKPLLPQAILESLQQRFNAANDKLVAMESTNKNASWLNKVRNVSPSLSLIPPEINSNVLGTVQEALLNDKQIDLHYQSFNQENIKPQIINPLALIQRGNISYLVATAFEYTDYRLYAVHRMQSAVILERVVKKSKDFDIDDFINKGEMNFGSCKPLRLKASISNDLKKILDETPLSSDQVMTGGSDDFMVAATVEDTWQLFWWLLSQGSDIEVIKPLRLRNKIKKELSHALERYAY